MKKGSRSEVVRVWVFWIRSSSLFLPFWLGRLYYLKWSAICWTTVMSTEKNEQAKKRNTRPNNNQLITLSTCVLLTYNTTIPCEYYLHFSWQFFLRIGKSFPIRLFKGKPEGVVLTVAFVYQLQDPKGLEVQVRCRTLWCRQARSLASWYQRCRSQPENYAAGHLIYACYNIVTVERIRSYKLVNAKHDNESDPTCIIESAPPKR